LFLVPPPPPGDSQCEVRRQQPLADQRLLDQADRRQQPVVARLAGGEVLDHVVEQVVEHGAAVVDLLEHLEEPPGESLHLVRAHRLGGVGGDHLGLGRPRLARIDAAGHRALAQGCGQPRQHAVDHLDLAVGELEAPRADVLVDQQQTPGDERRLDLPVAALEILDMVEHRVGDHQVVGAAAGGARQRLVVEVDDVVAQPVEPGLARRRGGGLHRLGGDVAGVDAADLGAAGDRALEPPLAAAEHQHLEPAAADPAVEGPAQPVALGIARGQPVEVGAHHRRAHPVDGRQAGVALGVSPMSGDPLSTQSW
jgi:hypothetical protein